MFLLAADLIVLLHLAFALFVLAGGIVVIRWRRAIWVHIPAVLWGALVEFADWPCPLTPLENYLRSSAGQAGYSGDFIQNYVGALLYPEDLARGAQLLIGATVVVVNGLLYWFLLANEDANG